MRYLTTVLFIVLFLLPLGSLQAYEFKIRAREHFDTVWITDDSQKVTEKYSGIGPVINFWMEDPYVHSIGLAWGLMYIHSNDESAFTDRNEDMELWWIGIESKHYFSPKQGGGFWRWGISSDRLETKGFLGEIKGRAGYLGLGYEIKFSRLGLAFEVARRRAEIGDIIVIDSNSPSIGLHFYGYI